MLLLEQDTTKKERIDEELRQMEFDTGKHRRKYKVGAIWDNAVYAKESEPGHLLGLYYLVSWKNTLKKKIPGI